MICTPHRVAQAQVVRVISCHPCMQLALLFDFELSIPSDLLFFSFSCSLSCSSSTTLRTIVTLRTPPTRRWSLFHESYLTTRPVCGKKVEIEERTKSDRHTLNQEKHDEVTDPTSTVRPVCGHESTKRCVLTPEHVERDLTSTVRPVKVEELDIDFRAPGLSHAIVKEAEHLRVQKLVKKDRKSSSSGSTSCRLAAEERLQPIQQKIEGHDSRIG